LSQISGKEVEGDGGAFADKRRKRIYHLRGFVNRVVYGLSVFAGFVLYHTGLFRVVQVLNRSQPKILLYHDIGTGDNAFIRDLRASVPSESFKQQMRFLKKHYRVISVDDYLCKVEQGVRFSREVVITFDDGFRSNYLHAFPLLKQLALPATIFLATDFVGNKKLMWNHKLAYVFDHDSRKLFEVLKGCMSSEVLAATTSRQDVETWLFTHYSSELVTRVLDKTLSLMGVDEETLARNAGLYLTWEEARIMGQEGITFGSHSRSHPVLSRLSPAELRDEVVDARTVLEKEVDTILLSVWGRNARLFPNDGYHKKTKPLRCFQGWRGN
jgi:peptidoglycan/xylan/chitin deacetylase (PgdA/CDA1 family)